MKLNELAPNPGSRQAGKRLGRGIGSGKGKTAGRGHKGQKARAGSATRTFEGGQMPIYRRLPKRGFKNPFRKELVPLNLDRLQAAVDAGRLDPGRPVDLEVLRAAGLVAKRRDGIRLLARGELTAPLTIAVDSASQAAAAAVAKAGGKLILPAQPEAPEPEAPKAKKPKAKAKAKAPAAEESAAEEAAAAPPASE
jgi:large subunit ribosomal protein L15